ncbi:MAG TPA: cytochrome c [Gemmataceae bacterium]|nr:cytochrome c [Gemmataceae bacterium]
MGTPVLALLPVPLSMAAEKTPADRGRDIMFNHSLNPAVWSLKAYDNVWKQWGVPAKPADYAKALMDRYGLQAAPFENGGRPMGLIESKNIFGKGIVNNCLLCHAGTIAGQTIIGLGNASLDLQSLFDDLSAADGVRLDVPFQFSYVRGTIDPVNPTTFLFQFRDENLNLRKPINLPLSRDVCSDPPAWWLIKKKQTRDWTGVVDARSTRIDMVNLLTPLNSGDYIRKQEGAFADIASYLLTIPAPKYPFPVDAAQAARGRQLFTQNCAKCHGTNGSDGQYPNQIVPLETLGTDPLLAKAMSETMVDRLNKSWLAKEIGPDGRPIDFAHNIAYQAPPLDGIWATAPYFHNGSVPTVYHVLNSKARPKIHTRSYKTGKEDYDSEKLGWKFTVLDQSPSPNLPPHERRKIYDTYEPGRGNAGHTFGDKLTEEERMAVIEYLKTL